MNQIKYFFHIVILIAPITAGLVYYFAQSQTKSGCKPASNGLIRSIVWSITFITKTSLFVSLFIVINRKLDATLSKLWSCCIHLAHLWCHGMLLLALKVTESHSALFDQVLYIVTLWPCGLPCSINGKCLVDWGFLTQFEVGWMYQTCARSLKSIFFKRFQIPIQIISYIFNCGSTIMLHFQGIEFS